MGQRIWLTDAERRFLVMDFRLTKRTLRVWVRDLFRVSRCEEEKVRQDAKHKLELATNLLRKLRLQKPSR